MAQPSFDDAEISAHVADQPRTKPHDQVAAELAERFGPERAWPLAMVREHRIALSGTWSGNRFAVERDAEVKAFIDDRIGLGDNANTIRRACEARFGWAPSRNSMYRYVNSRRDIAAKTIGLAKRPRAGGRPGAA